MSAAERAGPVPGHSADDVADLLPMVRRIVRARVGAHPSAEDLVQETLTRVLAASSTIEPGMLEPYAIVTARNVVASMWRDADRRKRNQHRALAARDGSTAGAVAAQLNRTRARLRVEYLLAVEQVEPPTERCRPVLIALSGGDHRRQREVQAAQHLLECEPCARLSQPLLERGQQREDTLRIAVTGDPDIVAARGAARGLAAGLAFGPTDLTVIATAVSEVCRNIVRFAGSGEVVVELLDTPRRGIQIVARDGGPGIPDVERALGDGFSTYGGLGLGLPGVRRLMDEFAIASEPGHGTTVTMTKWERTNNG